MISNLIRFDLGLFQPSKPFYWKLKYKEEVSEDFQRLPCFPRKMVLYSSTNFGILKPSAIIFSLIRLDLGFWQISKGFHRKLKYRENIFEEFEHLGRFPRKMILSWSTNFRIWKSWAIISNLIRFHLGFWQGWKAFHRKPKYREKVLEKFQRLPRFNRKIVLYSSTNFCILKPWAIISNLIRFDWVLWEISKPFYSNLKYTENTSEEFQRLPRFHRKMFFYSSMNFCILKALRDYFQLYKIWLRCLTGSKTIW